MVHNSSDMYQIWARANSWEKVRAREVELIIRVPSAKKGESASLMRDVLNKESPFIHIIRHASITALKCRIFA